MTNVVFFNTLLFYRIASRSYILKRSGNWVVKWTSQKEIKRLVAKTFVKIIFQLDLKLVWSKIQVLKNLIFIVQKNYIKNRFILFEVKMSYSSHIYWSKYDMLTNNNFNLQKNKRKRIDHTLFQTKPNCKQSFKTKKYYNPYN